MAIRSSVRNIVAPLALLVAADASAQQAGKLRLIIDPGGAYQFILDHRFRMQEREVELAAGPHHFSFWAPERRVVDTTLTVEAGVTQDILLRLPYSTEYLVYQRDLRDYRQEMRVHRMVPSLITVGLLAYTGIRWAKYKKAHDVLEDDRDQYDQLLSPHAITELKTQTIPRHQEDFDKAKRGFGIAAGITLVSAAVTAYMIHRSNKRPVPTFIDREKVKFDGLVWLPGPGGGQWMTGFTFDLARTE